MSSLTCIPVIKSFHGRRPYYLLDGFRYDLNFPLSWAGNHLAWEKDRNYLSGPKCCQYCRTTGCVDDVFVSYCFNCQKYIYDGKRLAPIDGMTELPRAIYHWQMGMATQLYGFDKNVISDSGILPPPPIPSASGEKAIDLSAELEDFSVKDAMYYEFKSLIN